MCKIKLEMDKFSPGYFEQKMVPIINDRLITFGYYGYGSWESGQLNSEKFEEIKKNLKLFVSKNKWSEKIMINIFPNKFWVYIKIKIK